MFQTYIMDDIALERQVDTAEFHFSKAFNQDCLSILARKLEAYPFSGSLLDWINSY